MKAAVRVALRENQSHLRKSLPSGFDPRAHGARSMAMVRHFAINLVRSARTAKASRPAARSRAGTRIALRPSSPNQPVNPDLLP